VDADLHESPKRVTVRRVQAYRPFPVDVLPDPVSRFINEGAVALGCDPAFLALPLLTVAGASIGKRRCERGERKDADDGAPHCYGQLRKVSLSHQRDRAPDR